MAQGCRLSPILLEFLFDVHTRNNSRMYLIRIIIEFKFLYEFLPKFISNIV